MQAILVGAQADATSLAVASAARVTLCCVDRHL
jgi:hypothetical protein